MKPLPVSIQRGILYKRGLKGVQGAKPPAGVWGVPSFSFSLAAAGGKDSLKSAPMGIYSSGARSMYTMVGSTGQIVKCIVN